MVSDNIDLEDLNNINEEVEEVEEVEENPGNVQRYLDLQDIPDILVPNGVQMEQLYDALVSILNCMKDATQIVCNIRLNSLMEHINELKADVPLEFHYIINGFDPLQDY